MCLGDIVGYGPDPNEVVERIRSLDAVAIRGNHDKGVSDLADSEDFNPVARAAVIWTQDQLTPENHKYIENSAERARSPSEPSRSCTALFYDEDEYVFSPALAFEDLIEFSHGSSILRPHARSGRIYASR